MKLQSAMVTGRKNISITEEMHAELNKIGARGESFDDIIRKCVEAYKREQAGKSKK